jgi:hypothetical protein
MIRRFVLTSASVIALTAAANAADGGLKDGPTMGDAHGVQDATAAVIIGGGAAAAIIGATADPDHNSSSWRASSGSWSAPEIGTGGSLTAISALAAFAALLWHLRRRFS